ncbi:hypothetical protein [Fibrobacter sp. UBA4297]|uniref:hypothetical protein n=1 Tax=Fibrobacter sp. UBA4297 TaxID=1946536 RepID=UPI0025BEC72E|nr:hypothetical protein [Fibrobacter sp. UBA4297]
MRLMMCMDSWKTRGLNVLVMLLLALAFSACNEDKDIAKNHRENVVEPSVIEVHPKPRVHPHPKPGVRIHPSQFSWRFRPADRPKINYLFPKGSIEDTVNYTPEEKAKNYQNSFKIWSGVYRLKSQKTAFDTSSLKLDENYEIPFVGKKLKIGDNEYSTFEMVELVQKEKTALLNVIASKIKWSNLSFRLDLNELRKSIDSLQTIKELFSEIDFKMGISGYIISNRSEIKSHSIDLLNLDTNDQFVEFPLYNKFFIEYTPKIKNQKVKLGNLRTETEVDASILTENTMHYENEKILFSSNVISVVLDFPGITDEKTESLPIGVKWDFLNASITKNGIEDNVGPIEKVKKVKRVDFPVKDYLEQYYDKNFYLSIEEYFGAFEELEIPFLDNPVFSFGRDFFSLKNLIETIDNYDRFVLYATTEATELKEGVEGGKIKIKEITDSLKRHIRKNMTLRNVSMYNKSFEDLDDVYNKSGLINLMSYSKVKKNRTIRLRDQENVLVYKITLKPLELTKNIDFGLFKTENFDVDFVAYIQHRIYLLLGYMVLDNSYVDAADLKLSARVNEINLGDKKILFGDGSSKNNGRLDYFIRISPDAEDSSKIVKPALNLDYESLTVKDGDRIVATVNNQNHKERFSYDFNRDKWIIPSSLKPYVTLSKRNMKFDE